MAMTTDDLRKDNGLICFTNCLTLQEDGKLVEKDLWIDARSGIILDAQNTFFVRKERPDTVINLGGNVLSPGLIDMQINGAYSFDFSEFDGKEESARAYHEGLDTVARRIVETGVTALLPTIVTQTTSLYPSLLSLLRPYTPLPDEKTGSNGGATILGWHAEGPFLQPVKSGAHEEGLLLSASNGWSDVAAVYGEENLGVHEDWHMPVSGDSNGAGVRMVTVAPEVDGMMDAIAEFDKRGIIVSIGHSVASSDVATRSIRRGAKVITHLFNRMPQLHHRDPGIIGLIGASPASLVPGSSTHGTASPATPNSPSFRAFTGAPSKKPGVGAAMKSAAEAYDDLDETPPHTPIFRAFPGPMSTGATIKGAALTLQGQQAKLNLNDSKVTGPPTPTVKSKDERPYYGIIVDGAHSHPNSVRLAYTAHKDGCILITDAMKVLDPSVPDGPHPWRAGGPRFIKDNGRLYLEGYPDTLAGSVITLDACVRNLVRFTGCDLGEALRCATYNPAKCLGIQSKKGTLRPGADADLVVMDRYGNVVSTWVMGKEVWKRE